MVGSRLSRTVDEDGAAGPDPVDAGFNVRGAANDISLRRRKFMNLIFVCYFRG